MPGGVKPARVKKDGAQAAKTAERRKEISRLRCEGLTQEEIGKRLGISQPAVSVHLKQAADEARRQIVAGELYRLETDLQQLEWLEQKAAAMIQEGSDIPTHAAVILRTIEARRKLLDNDTRTGRALRLYAMLEKRFQGLSFGAMVDAAVPAIEEQVGGTEPFRVTFVETSAEDLPREPAKNVSPGS